MRRGGSTYLVWLILWGFGCSADEGMGEGDFEPDTEVFAVGASEDRVSEVRAHPGLQAPVDLMVLLLADGEGEAAAERIAGRLGGEIVGQIPSAQYYQIRLPTTTMSELESAIATAGADDAVEAAGYDFLVRYRDCPAPSDVSQLDAESACPWTDTSYLALLDVFEERGGDIPRTEVAVAVVDSGINVANGEFDDVRITNVHAPGGTPTGMSDPHPTGHGTRVAGVIAADDGDGGVNGIASRALGDRLRLVWGMQPLSAPSPRDVASQSLAAIQAAIVAGARVVNCSFGFGRFATPTPNEVAIRRAFRRLFRNHPDVLFVVGVANENWELTARNDAPAGIALPNVISVGSSMPCDPAARVGPSARGPRVEIVAQGESIPVVDPVLGRPAQLERGTSFAAPQVASAAAILRSLAPTLSAAEVRDVLLDNAKLGPETTAGRSLDIGAAVLQLLLDQGSVLATDIDPDDDGVADDPGLVAGRVCGGTSITVEGFPTEGFSATSRPEDGTFSTAFIGTDGFVFSLQKPGFITFSLACEGCAWDLATFPVTDDPSTGAAGVFSLGSSVGGETVSGEWDIAQCVIESRYPPILSADEGPETVLIKSTATGVMEVSTATFQDEPRPFEAVIDLPFTVEPLAADHPLILAVESACENGRGR